MSSLRVLELSDLLVPPNVPPLPLLTKLHVDCMLSTGDFVSLTLDWVSTFLQSTPNLTDLSLGELSAYDERTITTPLSKISLPKLKTISVHGADISTIKLFDFLELPLEPMKKVSFSCSSDPDRELDMVDIMGTLKALCARVASVRREHGLPISKVSLIEGLQPDYGLRLYGAYTLDPFLEVLLCDLSASEIFDICSSSIPLLQADELVIGGVHTSKTLQA
ncbi:hypothetical protein ONZ45_g11361 [Pleurotus djamor]|nr:hypothetical protein ONZ45_g11361 [Pleurotus djamor]